MHASRLYVLLVVLAAAGGGKATAQQTPASQKSPEAVEARTLLQLEDDWCKGLVNRDVAIFRKLMAPGFIYTENAKMFSRDSVIKSLLAGDKVERAVNQYMQVHEFGPAAVVTCVLAVTSRGKTGAYTTRYRFTDTWLNTGGTWQIIAAQDYVIPDRTGQ